MMILKFFPPSPSHGQFKQSSCSQTSPSKIPSTVSRSLSVYNSQQHQPLFSLHSANQSVAAIIFGDGSESKLYPLTNRRSEGAIPLAANYRLIDAVVSNCINSNISKIYALTQFNSTSLNSHIARAYSASGLGKESSVEVIAAYQSLEHENWFQGTADAVRRCLWLLEENPVTEFLVLPGHHLYKMDYQKVIEAHRRSKADITIAVSSSKRNYHSGFGNVIVDSTNQVLEIIAVPEEEASSIYSARIADSTIPSHRNFSSMGIYVISRESMIKLLHENFPKANDLDSQVIPSAVSTSMKVKAYLFDGYWEDMKNIKDYYQANMDCAKQRTTTYKSVTLFTGEDESITMTLVNVPSTSVPHSLILF